MTGDLKTGSGSRRRSWRGIRTASIRTRALAIVLIPSAALLITGGCVAGYLISEGLSARSSYTYFTQSSEALVRATSALQQERTISLQALGGNRHALASLPGQWKTTDAALSRLSAAAQAPTGSTAGLRQLISELPAMRRSVEKGTASLVTVDTFYTRFTDGGSETFLSSALAAPSAAAAADEISVLDLFAVPDTHSRVVGLGAGWAARGVVPQSGRLLIAQLAGTYRNQLQALAPRLSQSGRAAYTRLVGGSSWRLAQAGEDDLAETGRLSVPVSSWLAAENTVSAQLLALWGDDLHSAQEAAVAAANQTLSWSVLLGSLTLVLAVAAFAAALVLSNGLVRRLRRLRSETLELADVTLPSLVRRIGDGEQVNVGAAVAMSGYGRDEIGQVADAFNTAQGTAVSAAAAEARARAGINRVFLDIAHRSQMVVHRQLEVLDVAEAKQSDPEHLELLFQLDHLATRARRNAENLLILGGGQPGRKWRRSAALEDIVRSAVSETEHFARVSTVRLPGVQVQGSVVGDLIHLLAELVDNATAFSPPEAAVTVRGNTVGRGVAVEIEDQGLGMVFSERERLNETLRNPPGFQAMALSGQRQLGLFVVGQLAQRHGITVSLQESAYGGISAIALIPSDAVEPDAAADGDPPPAGRPGRHEQPRRSHPEMTEGPLPPRRGRAEEDQPGRPPERRPAQPLRSSPSRPAPRAAGASPSPRGAVPGPGAGTAGRGRAPLPRRERMASLAPGLRLDAPAAEPGPPSRRTRSPEEARGSMSAFQRGTRLGREAPGQDNPVKANGGQ
jgi:Nitrate and nitrite sensing/Histidine kinase-, DNA gyrase B-, and HSP90-like ATPase/HAMP domain